MESKTFAPSPMATTLGKLLAGVFLYEAEDGNGAKNIQEAAAKVRKWIGEEETKKLLDGSQDQLVALISACVDQAVIGTLTAETKELLAKLDPASKVFIEMVYFRLTGQELHDQRREPRWEDNLWKLRKFSKRYIVLSPSKVTEDELAKVIKEVAIPFIATVREYMLKLV